MSSFINLKKRKRYHSNISKNYTNDDIERHCQSLPIFHKKKLIIHTINKNKVVIIVGEPGSGKTTQIPKYLYQKKSNGCIACTQPRRVAAITIAQRVALELNVNIGQEVGYSVRFDENYGEKTKIKYVTDGMLLQESISDSNLLKYSTIIIDEAHERSLQTDILLSLLKRLLNEREASFRLVLMSATIDVKKFQEFFNEAKCVHIGGRQHPVTISYTDIPQENYIKSTIERIFKIHMEEKDGDILVFLTGQDEIESLGYLVKEAYEQKLLLSSSEKKNIKPLEVFTLYAAMAPQKQLKVFLPVAKGVRKVILSTNISETSLTISGVSYIIDTGLFKMRKYNAKTGIDSLQIAPISKAQAQQRCGRAGREGPGIAYRLYTKESYDKLKDQTIPEILRTDISDAILKIKAIGINDILNLDFLDMPPKAAIIRALQQLHTLKALDDNGNLTNDIGYKMSHLPLIPMYSKILIEGCKNDCSNEIISILSMISSENIFIKQNNDNMDNAFSKERISRFINKYGDHLTLLNVYQQYMQIPKKNRKSWCHLNAINFRSMLRVLEIHKQLSSICNYLKMIDLTKQKIIRNDVIDEDMVLKIRKSLTCGLFLHAAVLQQRHEYKLLSSGQIVKIHPSSVLHLKKAKCVVFNEIVYTSKVYVRDVTSIDVEWLNELIPDIFK